MVTATYMSNFLLFKAIDNKIPWEVWHQKLITKEILNKLLSFSSVVYIHMPRQHHWTKEKLTTHSMLSYFIGYQVLQTGESIDIYKV